MKNLKKVLALVTMFTMLLSVAVSAGTLYPDVDDNASYAEAVETLNVLGIMIGDEKGNFNPDASITRAEAAAIVTRVKNLGNAASAVGGTNFTDVAADHWAAGYINLAEQSGIINGYGDGTFGPENPVTYEQIIKMVVAALGRTPEAEVKGGYPSGYLIVAAQEDINLGVAVTAGADAPRAAVSRLVFNALEVDVMEMKEYKPGEESYEVKTGKTLLKDYLKVSKFEGVISKTYLSEGNVSKKDLKTITIAGVGETLYEGDTNAADFLGYNVSAYAKKDEDDKMVLLGVAKKAGKNEVLELTFADLKEADYDAGTLSYYETNTRTEDIAFAKTAMFYNGGAESNDVKAFLTGAGTNTTKSGVLTFIDNDPTNDIYEVVMLKKASAPDRVVGEIDAENKVIKDRTGVKVREIDYKDEDKKISFYKADGSSAEFEDIAEGNVLTFYNNGDVISVYISDVKVEGKVSEVATIKGAKNYTIGDGVYTASSDLNVSDEGTFYVNVEGVIVDKVATTANRPFGYLYAAGIKPVSMGKKTVEIQYLTAEGEWVTTDLANTMTVVNAGVSTTFSWDEKAGADDTMEAIAALANFLTVTDELVGDKYVLADVAAAAATNQMLFQYSLNAEGKINKLYIGSVSDSDLSTLSKDSTQAGKEYRASSKSLGKLFFNDETPVFVVKDDGSGNANPSKEKDIIVTKASAFFNDGVDYTKVEGYNCENGYPQIAVVYGMESPILPGTNLLVITRVSSTKNNDNEDVLKLYGLQQGEEVSGETVATTELTKVDAADGAYASDLKAGDVVIFSLDGNGKIDNIRVLMSYTAAKAAIAADNTAETIAADVDGAYNFFGYAESIENGVIWLTTSWKTAGQNSVKNDLAEDASLLTNLSDINVYEINTVRETPTFDVISTYEIESAASDDYDTEAHWLFIREYDDKVIDVVAYKAVTPYEETVTTPVKSFVKVEEEDTAKKLVLTSEEGATIYYSINGADYVKYTAAVEVAADDVIKAYAVAEGKNDSPAMTPYTVLAEDIALS